MRILYRYEKTQGVFDIAVEAKKIAKTKGYKTSEIGHSEIVYNEPYISLRVYDKKNHLIASLAT